MGTSLRKIVAPGLVALIAASFSFQFQLQAAQSSRHVVLLVWDGMRPDFISDINTPTLASLARQGVTFRNHHSVFLSSTEVNGTAISTGAYPAHSGIIGNTEYRPEIEALKPIHTEALSAVRKGDELSHGHYLRVPTIAELVRRSGFKTAVAGSKPVALLADRNCQNSAGRGINVFAGATFPPSLLAQLTSRYGAFPAYDSTDPRRTDWATSALLDPLWSEGVPEFSLLWLNEPDLSQHESSPGSERSFAAMRNADKNLARVLQALEQKGVRKQTDVLVVSDHGASTISAGADLAAALTKAGLPATREFKTKPSAGEILAVSNGGAILLYIIGHNRSIVEKVVGFLQRWEFSGPVFCREPLPGTFRLGEVHLDSKDAPDLVVAMRWNSETNRYGVQGMIASDESSYGPGQGSHVTLSPFDMHATLVASGPHFRLGINSTLATGNVDVAPTILWVLGIKPPASMDGRVLTEALTIRGPEFRSFQPGHIEAKVELDGTSWSQYLNFTEVNGVRYLDEGNAKQSSSR